jgi:general secretion pathway protein I
MSSRASRSNRSCGQLEPLISSGAGLTRASIAIGKRLFSRWVARSSTEVMAKSIDAIEGRSSPIAGFTLIEVLVALAIVAILLSAIGAVIATTVKGTRSLDRRLSLNQTAQRLLASLPNRDTLQPGTKTGISGGYRWRLDVASLAAPPRNSKEPIQWVPLAVTLRLQAVDGPVLRLDTVRLVRSSGESNP